MSAIAKFIILIFMTQLISCVNVNLAKKDGALRAEGVQIKAPSSPFQMQKREDVDGFWKNSKNGNVISYLSDCKDPSDPPLENIIQGVLLGLTELKYETDEAQVIQGREGRRVLAYGKVDGVPSAIDLLVFKRNQCIYILSYVGVRKSFADNRPDFGRFIEGFKAP
jgi:hypothetical protein